MSSMSWVSRSDPEAKIAKMKQASCTRPTRAMIKRILVNGILVAAALFCLAALAYASTRFDSLGAGTARLVAFFIVPGLLGVLFLACLRLAFENRVMVAVMTVAIGMGIYGTEFFLAAEHRPSRNANPFAEWAAEQGRPFDRRTKREVVEDLRGQGVDAYPAVFPKAIFERKLDGTVGSPIAVGGEEVMPLAGIANVVTVLCNELGEYVVFKSDRHGFNNPNGLWTGGAATMVTIGDSLTVGSCVPPGRSYVDRIRQRFPRTVNLGVSANGPMLYLASLKEYGPLLRPRVVLWFHIEDSDLQDLALESRSTVLARYMEDGYRQSLENLQEPIDQALKSYAATAAAAGQAQHVEAVGFVHRMIGFVSLERLRLRMGVFADLTVSEPDYAKFERILQASRNAVSQWGGQIQLVYLPARHRYLALGHRARLDGGERRAIAEIARRLSIPLLDFVAVLDGQDVAALYPEGPASHHYNDRGHALVAKTVRRYIEDRGLIDTSADGSAAK